MGVDRQKVKQKIDEEEQKQAMRGAGGYKYWTPKNGDNRVRIMPPWTYEETNPNRAQFAREIYVHWRVGVDEENQKSFACPVRTPHAPSGGRCPICSYVQQLRNSKDAADAEMANDIRAKQQFYSNIVDLDDPVYTNEDLAEWKTAQDDKTRDCPFSVGETKVQVYRYGQKVAKELFDYFMQSDISDLQSGRDVVVKRNTPNPKEPRRTDYATRVNFEPSSFNLIGKLEQKLVNLDAIMPFAAEADMLAAISGQPAPAVGGQPPPRQSAPAPVQARPQLPPATPPTPPAQPAAPPQQTAPAEPPPPCFKDPQVHSTTDPECVGGQKGTDVYDKCPVFDACHEAVVQLLKPSRRAARKAPEPAPGGGNAAVDQLESQMRNALKH